jgi:integrase
MGARLGELLGLLWADIDFSAWTTTLHDTENGDCRILTLPAPAITRLMWFRGAGNYRVFPADTN